MHSFEVSNRHELLNRFSTSTYFTFCSKRLVTLIKSKMIKGEWLYNYFSINYYDYCVKGYKGVLISTTGLILFIKE
jgi:hypothetical protein